MSASPAASSAGNQGTPSVAVAQAPPETKQPARSSLWINVLHLFTLSSFAISQTLYDHISREPGLVAKNVNGLGALLVLVFLLSAVAPLILTAVEMLVGLLGRQARESMHVVLVLVLCTLLVLPVLNRFGPQWPAVGVLIAAIVLGTLAAMAYSAWPRLRSVVTVASLAVVVFPAMFLFNSPVTREMFSKSEQHTAASRPIPVVMVVFDEFCGASLENEAHGIDSTRYPNFAALAKTSDWYRNATAVHAQTSLAVPALLTGNRIRSEHPPVLAAYPNNLLDLMARSRSHEAVIFEPYTRLAPEVEARSDREHQSILLPAYNLLPTLGIVFLHHICPVEERVELPKIPFDWFGLNSKDDVNRLQRSGVIRWPWTSYREDQFDHFLNCIRPGPKATGGEVIKGALPQFLFLHIVVPHVPLVYLPSGHKYQIDTPLQSVEGAIGYGFADPNWRQDELAVARAHQRYLLQVGYADHCLGRLQKRLREQGIFDDCLLIVTGDHGTSFHSRLPRREPLEETLGDLMSVPLFVKWPGQTTGSVSDRNVEAIDVLPTLAEVLGLSLPSIPEGQSFLDAKSPERPEKIMLHGAEYRVPKSFPQKQAVRSLIQSRFGFGNGWKGVYSLGPFQELVGRPVSGFKLGDPAGIQFSLQYKWTYVPDSPHGQRPGLFAGSAASPTEADYPLCLAIAVNGVIQGVTRTYDFRTGPEDQALGGRDRWELCIPEEAFQPGENQVEYYVVRGAGDKFTLHPAHN